MNQKTERPPMTQAEVIHELSKKCLERLDARGLKGKKRIDAAIEYIAGAAQAMHVLGEPYNLDMHFFLVCTRGISEVESAASPDFIKPKGEPVAPPEAGNAPALQMAPSDWGLNQAHG